MNETKPGFPVLVAVVIAGYCLSSAVQDTDLFWQAKFGELILANGGPVYTEPFYPDAAGRPIIPIYWLAQVFDAVCIRIGGWELLKLMDAIIWALAFTLPAWQAGRYWGKPIQLATLVGFFTASIFYMLRPQSFAMLGMGSLIALLFSSQRPSLKVVIGVVILLLWQNCHPSVIVGGVLLSILVGLRWMGRWQGKNESPWVETILLCCVPLAMIATPAGFSVFELMRINSERVKLFGISEWMPIYDESNRHVYHRAAIGIVLMLVAMAVRGKRAGVWIVPALLFAGLTVCSHRFVVFFGIVVIPFWVAIQSVKPRFWRLDRRITIGLLAILIPLAYLGIKTGRLPLWNSWCPLDAIDSLEKEKVAGPVFVTTEWGGLISYRGYPNWRAIMDGRYFARTHEECEWYYEVIYGRVAIEDVAARYQPVAFVITDDCPKLLKRLTEHPGWRVAHRDANAVVFVQKQSTQ